MTLPPRIRLSTRQRMRLALERGILRAWGRARDDAGLLPPNVLDLGVERGDSGRAARRAFGPGARIHGIDVWAPNVEAVTKAGIYDAVWRDDALDLVLGRGEAIGYDVIIAAELLEHLSRPEGEALLDELVEEVQVRPGDGRTLLLVTTPIGWMPQGAIDGNPHEEHRSAWLPGDFRYRGFEVFELPPVSLLVAALAVPALAPAEWRA